ELLHRGPFHTDHVIPPWLHRVIVRPPRRGDVDATGEAYPAIDGEDLAVVPARDSSPAEALAPRQDGVELHRLDAASAQLVEERGICVDGADSVVDHPRLDPALRRFYQYLKETLTDMIGVKPVHLQEHLV